MNHVFIVFLTLGFCSCAYSQDLRDVHFVEKVLPVLKTKCFACHGENSDEIKGDLDATSLKGLLRGGESGLPAISLGSPSESPLMEAIRWDGLEMPPKENDRLSKTQIADFQTWIQDGAHWPGVDAINKIRRSSWNHSSNEDGELVSTSGGLSDDWTYRRYKAEDLWAIRAIQKPAAPANGYSIDSFIQERLQPAGIPSAPRASARELIRRASYDLTGLPPTPQEVSDFESHYHQNDEAAWKELIERLLASPHYGERWGQHWLDVVRYADTAGFSNDFELSNLWRYRDYVIRSFNDDVPYNQFVLSQIAGDEWYQEQMELSEEASITQSEATVATGFLRVGPWEHTAMSPPQVSRQNYLDDLVDNVGKTFLSTALRCCKCHDHKFDPIPTKDYYRFYAAFSTTQPAEIEADFIGTENRSLFEGQKKNCEDLLRYAQHKLDELLEKRESAAKNWYRERGIEDQYRPWNVRQRKDFTGRKPPRNFGLTPQEEGRLKVREQDVRIWKRRLKRFFPQAQSVYNGPVLVQNSGNLTRPKQLDANLKPEDSYIFSGGDVFSPHQKVSPGILSCVGVTTNAATAVDKYALPTSFSNRRLGLARWIANPQNGLAIRSIVNRVWHYHFGQGIAANPNNFGATGAKPTHPELLEWLAVKFIDSGWSIKSLHRQIMTSETYMRSTHHPDFKRVSTIDPENQLHSYFDVRRLTAEEVRDSLLAASGELNLELGGLPIRPEINLDVALSPRMIQFSISPAYQPERLAKDRNRRSIYSYRVRGLRNPLLQVLDQPNLNESCENRDSASTAPQAFTMLNSDYVTKRSLAMAARLLKNRGSTQERIKHGYELATGQILNEKMLGALEEHYKNMLVYHTEKVPGKVSYPTSIRRSLVEENTGETFDYEELLNVYQDYEPDLHAAEVSPEVRALADICLIFFNSNQMMYVN